MVNWQSLQGIRGARDLLNSKWPCTGLDVDEPVFEEFGGACAIFEEAIAAQKELGVPSKITKGIERAVKACCTIPSSGDEKFECCNCSRYSKGKVSIIFKRPNRNGTCQNYSYSIYSIIDEVSFPETEIKSEALEELMIGELR